jgi:GNAT superfamily N-acetyltransferase
MRTIRYALPSDASAITRLLRRAHAAVALPFLASGVLLVVDAAAGELGAALHLDLGDGTGRVDALVVDPALAGTGLDVRMLGVAEAYCVAHGCRVEVAAT